MEFAFATKDVVKVGNDEVTGYYTFTNDGTVFTSTDAKQTAEAANWCAFFPGEKIDLRNQSGAFADVAKNYALAGATASATTGSDGLEVTMKAKVAVLCIVGVNKDEILDINVQDADGKYISGLAADKKSAGFSVQIKDTKVSLLSKTGAGVYYVVVPAGVKISVYNGDKSLYSGDKSMSTTKADGLKAGKYYTLTTGMTKGSADNSLGETIDWVQLWPGGPKFAKENVKNKLSWSEATAEGSAYVWGANWRTPTKEELNFVNYKQNPEDNNFYVLTPLNTKVEVKNQNGAVGLLYTGIQPGYTDKSIFLPFDGGETYFEGGYWTSTIEKEGFGTSFGVMYWGGKFPAYHFHGETGTSTATYWVRPVLAK